MTPAATKFDGDQRREIKRTTLELSRARNEVHKQPPTSMEDCFVNLGNLDSEERVSLKKREKERAESRTKEKQGTPRSSLILKEFSPPLALFFLLVKERYIA